MALLPTNIGQLKHKNKMKTLAEPLEVAGTIKTTTKLVTPEWAEAQLEKCKSNPNYINRRLDEKAVEAMATDIRAGYWTPNPNPIAFDVEGTLIDGQHRLWAVFFAGVPVQMQVSTGWPKGYDTSAGFIRTIDNIDRGRTRTAGQQLSLSHGVRGGNVVAAALRSIACIITGDANLRLTMSGTLLVKEHYGNDVQRILDATTMAAHRKANIVGALALFHHIEPEKCMVFARSFFKMENLAADSIELVLFKWLERNSGLSYGPRSTRMAVAHAVAHALRAVYNEEKIGRLNAVPEMIKWLVVLQGPSGRKVNEFLTSVRKARAKLELPSEAHA